jgi:hypothetical protein
MVVKMKNKDPMVFECNQMHGVAIYEWKQYITYFDLYGRVVLRKLQLEGKQDLQTKLIQFVRQNLGQKYELSASKLLTMETDFNWEGLKEKRSYFCS